MNILGNINPCGETSFYQNTIDYFKKKVKSSKGLNLLHN
jgi:hypothetical protein